MLNVWHGSELRACKCQLGQLDGWHAAPKIGLAG